MIPMFLLLSGCFLTTESSVMPLGLSPAATLVGVEAASVMGTQKTIGDHIASKMTGLDCSTPRAQIDNGEVCRQKPQPAGKRPQVYCYRTLAEPDCYLEPSINSTDVRVGYPR